MNVLRTIRKAIRATSHAAGRWLLGRRFEAADTNRLNKEHWRGADDRTLNETLPFDLDLLRRRCEHEAKNNSLVEGVINTWVDDVVGELGPTMQCESGVAKYDRAIEEVWSDWWEECDYNAMLAGVDILKLSFRQLWTNGEFLVQIVDGGPDWMIGAKLLPIMPRRLATPPYQMTDAYLGIKRNKTGRPITYFVEEYDESELFRAWTGNYLEIPADQMIHFFRMTEPGQIRGYPWLTSALQTIADLRDYDAEVLDAARAAANQGVMLWTDHIDAGFVPENSVVEIERRMQTHVPPGWKVEQLKPEQPTTNYVDYRKERQRDFARAVGMPLMTVRLDSSDHNYSSARFDGQVYQRGVRAFQREVERRVLNRLVRVVAREAELSGLTPMIPNRMRLTWTWPTFPHVDPTKEKAAEKLALSNGTLTLTDALAADGQSLEGFIAKRSREMKLFTDAGITSVLAGDGSVAMVFEEALKDGGNGADKDQADAGDPSQADDAGAARSPVRDARRKGAKRGSRDVDADRGDGVRLGRRVHRRNATDRGRRVSETVAPSRKPLPVESR